MGRYGEFKIYVSLTTEPANGTVNEILNYSCFFSSLELGLSGVSFGLSVWCSWSSAGTYRMSILPLSDWIMDGKMTMPRPK